MAEKEFFITPTGEVILKDMSLTTLPSSLSSLPKEQLLHIDLRGNCLPMLEESLLFSFTHLRCIDLRNNNIELIGEEVANLLHLKVLRLDSNQLSGLPASIFSLQTLQVLTFSCNHICVLSDSIKKLHRLTTLIASDNQIKSIPSEIGDLRRLRTLHIHGNHFSEIPTSLRKLESLIELSLEWFRYTLPMLPRFLKGHMGEAIISSLRDLLKQKSQATLCSISDFLTHFSDKSFSIGRKDLRNRSLLHIAAAYGDCGVIQGLLESGVDVNALDCEGLSPLVVAIKEDKIHAARILLETKGRIDVNIGGSHAGSALHLAVFKSEIWITRTLIRLGANPNARDCEGNTPLHILSGTFSSKKKKNALIGDALLAAGALPTLCNNEGYAPIHIAARRGQTSAIAWMATEGVDVNLQGEVSLNTALHLSAHSGHLKTVLCLTDNHAIVDSMNCEGKTPKDMAKTDLAIYKYLAKAEKQAIRVHEFHEKAEEELNYQDVILDTAQPMHIRYRGLYNLFNSGNYQDMNFVCLELEDSVLKADAFYMLSYMKNRHLGKILENVACDKTQMKLVRKEAKAAACRINSDERNLETCSLIGPKLHSKPMQMSLPMNLSAYIEEDTRQDSLMRNVI